MAEKATLIDVSKCMACRGCQVACKQWNQLPAEPTTNRGTYENPPDLSPRTVTRVIFREEATEGKLSWLFRKHQCMHCTQAACVELCPSNAAYSNEFGFTEIDPKKCIGCGVCEKFCPFEVPRVDYETHKAKKCWFCLDRVSNGLEPACVKTCPTDALKFGDRQQLLDQAYQVMAQPENSGVRLYGERELGGLHVLYLLPGDPVVYGLPKHPQMPNPFEAYAFLEESLRWSPIKDRTLTMAALKYFGHVYV